MMPASGQAWPPPSPPPSPPSKPGGEGARRGGYGKHVREGAGDAMIRFDNVSKSYGTKKAVEGLTLHVPAGELFAFLGPNGAGKTTTIKMLCGLLFPTSGRIFVGGFDMVAQGDRA